MPIPRATVCKHGVYKEGCHKCNGNPEARRLKELIARYVDPANVRMEDADEINMIIWEVEDDQDS